MYTAKGLAGLRNLARDHSEDAVDEAVREYLLRSATDREIAPGHVKSWAYFERFIREWEAA